MHGLKYLNGKRSNTMHALIRSVIIDILNEQDTFDHILETVERLTYTTSSTADDIIDAINETTSLIEQKIKEKEQ